MPVALVTGGTGLVGSHVVERLHAEGWTVRALVRDPRAAAWLVPLGAQLVQGDVLDPQSFRAAAAGSDVMVHGAAAIFHGDGWPGYHRTNVTGTANAIAAARASGSRLVQVSSVAVYGAGHRYRPSGRPTDEKSPLPALPPHGHYARSKRESEALVLAAHEAGEIWAAAVRPCVVYGPRDRQFVPRMARLIRRAAIPMVGGGRATLAVVHAANVADGIVRAAATTAAGGRAYNLTNDHPVTARQFFELAAVALGTPLRTIALPLGVAELLAAAIDRVGPLLGMNRSVASARASLDFLGRDNPFSSERARRELGWAPPVAPATGVPEAFRWWAEHHAPA